MKLELSTNRKLFAGTVVVNVNMFVVFALAGFAVVIAEASHLVDLTVRVPCFVVICADLSSQV